MCISRAGQGLLGWATFPWSYAETSKMHGVVMHGSLPGGNIANYNQGGTLAHEAGHYLGPKSHVPGRLHGPGDQAGVDDTPYEATSTTGCPSGKDTCPATGRSDPQLHGLLVRRLPSEFTAQQITRMQSSVGTYRPNLCNAAVAAGQAGADGSRPRDGRGRRSNIYPNPFTAQTNVQLVMPRSGG